MADQKPLTPDEMVAAARQRFEAELARTRANPAIQENPGLMAVVDEVERLIREMEVVAEVEAPEVRA